MDEQNFPVPDTERNENVFTKKRKLPDDSSYGSHKISTNISVVYYKF